MAPRERLCARQGGGRAARLSTVMAAMDCPVNDGNASLFGQSSGRFKRQPCTTSARPLVNCCRSRATPSARPVGKAPRKGTRSDGEEKLAVNCATQPPNTPTNLDIFPPSIRPPFNLNLLAQVSLLPSLPNHCSPSLRLTSSRFLASPPCSSSPHAAATHQRLKHGS